MSLAHPHRNIPAPAGEPLLLAELILRHAIAIVFSVAPTNQRVRTMVAFRGAVTDFGYLLQAAFPSLGRLLVPLFQRTYRRLAPRYEATVIGRAPDYSAPLRVALALVSGIPQWCGDIAAGTGAATRELRARFPEAQIIAVDLSPPMLRELRIAGVHRLVGSGWALPLATGRLDLVVIQNGPPSFTDLARVVRPGGTVLFSLSSAGLLPPILRRWLLSRAVPPALAVEEETAVGRGVAWSFRRLH